MKTTLNELQVKVAPEVCAVEKGNAEALAERLKVLVEEVSASGYTLEEIGELA